MFALDYRQTQTYRDEMIRIAQQERLAREVEEAEREDHRRRQQTNKD